MALEIERRFVVNELPDLSNIPFHKIKQGYLSKPGDVAVTRVRAVEVDGNQLGFLTIKTRVSAGISNEYEYSIPYNDAVSLLLASGDLRISKTRYCYLFKDKVFEIDVFHDYLDGLVIAEIELDSLDELIELPSFIGKEITGVKGLSNFEMANDPVAVRKIIKNI
jgi:adenylate cyclase